MRRALAVLVLSLAACPPLDAARPPNEMSSFKVTVLGVFQRMGNTRASVPVAAACIAHYGSEAAVPPEVKGQPDCRYVIPRGEVEFDVKATALRLNGEPFRDFNGAVSFRVVPGDLVAEQQARWAVANLGELETTVRALHPYGEARVWVEDASPKLLYDGGETLQGQLPAEPAKRTFATGTSAPIYFSDQTLQSLQLPGELDNRSSPFAGEFVVVGKNPASGETLKQTCADDPVRNGRESLMVVTGIDQSGFFVTDISACRLKEVLSDSSGNTVRTPEPFEPCWLTAPDGTQVENLDGGNGQCNVSQKACRQRRDCPAYSPGNFASMFVYNYNVPDGLDEGDLLFTLAGSVQEFTSTTQLVFPSWTTAERVRLLPQSEWNKWLQYVKPYELNARTCGQDDAPAPFLTDALCGHNRRNLKMESLESSLVRLRRVRFPQKFVNCDFNANGSVPFFCETKPEGAAWQWSTCSFDAPEPEVDRVERECNMNCTIGMGDYAGTLCSERATLLGFGQYVVEMAAPGPSTLGMDSALPQRMQTTLVPAADGGTPSVRVPGYGPGVEVAVTCDQPAHYRPVAPNGAATDADPVLSPGQILRHVLGPTESTFAFKATSAPATCTVGINARTRINLMTKDAVPELNPDCDEADADAALAAQCKNLRGADFDITGHLRQIQPGRPRWLVIPRSPDDLCCYPGPGLECPRPIRPCP